jgi:AcrR family transcriptional regulator
VPPSAASSEHVRGKQRRRREAILHAALRAFRDRGYHATTLEDIARRLDVRKTALYYYFPDKESILYECHRQSLTELERILAEARALATPGERLRHVIREHVRVMTGTLEGSPLAFEVTAFSPERQAEIIAARTGGRPARTPAARLPHAGSRDDRVRGATGGVRCRLTAACPR